LDNGKHYWQWGLSGEQQTIHDKLNEWEYQDSAGYNIPYNPSTLEFSRVTKSSADLDITRISGYIQDNILFQDSADFTLQAGVRFNYNTLNNEFLLAPRIGFAWKPSSWRKDVIFRGAVGIYQQPPFYRELRRYDGTLNTDLKAQKAFSLWEEWIIVSKWEAGPSGLPVKLIIKRCGTLFLMISIMYVYAIMERIVLKHMQSELKDAYLESW
jgi:hypothetical protein